MTIVQAVPLMKTQQALHMKGGAGENSYATNSRLQEKVILRTKPVVEKAILDLINNSNCPPSMVVADLGCSSGPNTLHFVAQIIDMVATHCHNNGRRLPEIQFFLNDLPTNDFNNIFQSLEEFEMKLKDSQNNFISHYIVGVPGTFYGRLFPKNKVHFFHSSYCLMWLSQVPEVLQKNKSGFPLNKGNINVSETSPIYVAKAFEEQFERDFSAFLSARIVELCPGGRMVLTFLGKKKKHLRGGELGQLYHLLADALNSLVEEGMLQRQKMDSFYVPVHTPSPEEIKTIIDNQGLFDIDCFETFQSNWDPLDDSEEDTVLDFELSGKNTAKCIRAVHEPIIARHFGVSDTAVMDELFSRYANIVSTHLKKEKTKHTVFVIGLKKKREGS